MTSSPGRQGIRQKILLRLTPGIDPHTYDAINTGKVDSKFGTAIETGQATGMIEHALSLPNLDLAGFHCHVGSQVFEEDVYQRTLDIMLPYMAEIRETLATQPVSWIWAAATACAISIPTGPSTSAPGCGRSRRTIRR